MTTTADIETRKKLLPRANALMAEGLSGPAAWRRVLAEAGGKQAGLTFSETAPAATHDDNAVVAELGKLLFAEAARRGEPITMKAAQLEAARRVHGTRSEHEAVAFAERQRRMPDSAELDRRAMARLRERGLTMAEPGAYKAALLEVSAEAVR